MELLKTEALEFVTRLKKYTNMNSSKSISSEILVNYIS